MITESPLPNINLDHLVCASLDQKRAPLDVRAKAVDAEIDWDAALTRGLPPATHWFILATCNRFEIYLHGSTVESSHLMAALEQTIEQVHRGSASELEKTSSGIGDSFNVRRYFDLFCGEAAAKHLSRVAAGLESKVLGEAQILGQLIRAYEGHIGRGVLGPELDAVLRSAIRVGKRVRHETQIGTNAGSIGSLAIQTVEAVYRRLEHATVSVIGLGEMGQLVARSAAARGARRLLLVNRTHARAVELAAEINGEAVAWEALGEAVNCADIIVSATSAPAPVITHALLERRAHGSSAARVAKVIVDLAVPRDVEPGLARRDGVTVIDIDQLQTSLDQSLAHRQAAIPQVEQIIHAEMERLKAQMRELAYRPLIVDLRQKAEQIRRQELARTLKFIQDADPDVTQHIEHLSRALVNKLLHEPTNWIRDTAGHAQEDVPDALVREMFGLLDANGKDEI